MISYATVKIVFLKPDERPIVLRDGGGVHFGQGGGGVGLFRRRVEVLGGDGGAMKRSGIHLSNLGGRF